MEEKLEKLIAELGEMVDRDDAQATMALIGDRHPVEIAEIVDGLDEGRKRQLFRIVEIPLPADVLQEASVLSRD